MQFEMQCYSEIAEEAQDLPVPHTGVLQKLIIGFPC